MSVLIVDSISVSRGGRVIARDMSFDASRGELLAVMGPSGSGKTTILRAIAGLEPLTRGTDRGGRRAD